MKNIFIPDEKSYKLQLIQNVEDFIKKVTWKAVFFMKDGNHAEPTAYVLFEIWFKKHYISTASKRFRAI